MEHDPAVQFGEILRSGNARAVKSILQAKSIVGEFLVVVDMPILDIECFVLGIVHPHHAIFDNERVLVILASRISADLDGPAVEVLAIEYGNPFALPWSGAAS